MSFVSLPSISSGTETFTARKAKVLFWMQMDGLTVSAGVDRLDGAQYLRSGKSHRPRLANGTRSES